MRSSGVDARFGAWLLVALAVLAAAGCSGSDSGPTTDLRRDAANAPGAIESGVSYVDHPVLSPFWIAVMVDAESPLAEFSEELGLAGQADRWDRFRDQVLSECDQEVGSWNPLLAGAFYVQALRGEYVPTLRERRESGLGVFYERLGQPIAVSNAKLSVAASPNPCIDQVRQMVYAEETVAFATPGDTFPEFWANEDVGVDPLDLPEVRYDDDWESCMRRTTGLDGYGEVVAALRQNPDLTLDDEREIAIEDWYCRQHLHASWIDTAYEHQEDYIDAHRDELATILTPNG